MNTTRQYKKRDYTFGLLLVTLREKVGFTQASITAHTGITEKALRNWESGSNYPKEVHLKTLIEFYLRKGAFAPGKERQEAYTLWEQMTQNSFRRKANFDDEWFAALLTAYYQERQGAGAQGDRANLQAISSTTEQQYAFSQFKEQFIFHINHELRTPLTELQGYLELLNKYGSELDEEARTMFVRNALHGCTELKRIIDDLLNVPSFSQRLLASQQKQEF